MLRVVSFLSLVWSLAGRFGHAAVENESTRRSSSSRVAFARTHRPFDEDWTFHRGNDIGSLDAKWTSVRLPHDWSIEDLPLRENDTMTPVLGLRYGDWVFSKGIGNDETWCAIAFDDSNWTHVKGGEDWRVHSNYTAYNATGWYRQHFSVEDWQINATGSSVGDLVLSLGHISGADETWINGVRIGATGNIHAPDPDDYVSWRRYSIPPNVLRRSSSTSPAPNVVAIKIKSIGGPLDETPENGSFPGGLFDDETNLHDSDVRSGPFDASASFDWRAVGSTVGGVGWYRKTFETPSHLDGRAFLRFDGVYMNSTVWLNNKLLGNRPYGYTTFEYDITDVLRRDASSNVLMVRVENLGQNSRWYAGSGIYRHVWLTTTSSDVHVPLWGVHVRTPEIQLSAPHTATVVVDTVVQNSGDSDDAPMVRADVSLFDPVGRLVPGSPFRSDVSGVLASGASKTLTIRAQLTDAKLWSPDVPNLYVASVDIVTNRAKGTGESVLDTVNQTFGIRHLNFSAQDGFRLNGQSMKMYGGCVHHANGPLGARALDRAEERRVEILKQNGYNAIRTSHNPVSPAFLDACDRLGVLVMEEAFDCWEEGKLPNDYHNAFDQWWQRDIEAMVLRDRSRPSVVMWSIGNEIPMRTTQKGYALSATLAEHVRALDPNSGRAVTTAVPGVADNDDDFFAPLDVAGYNYSPDRYVSDHDRFPDRIIVGTESFPSSSFEMWNLSWHHSFVIGDFIWTAIDYIGETGIGSSSFSGDVDQLVSVPQGYMPYGWHISFCGDYDICGHRKPQGVYRNVLWNVTDIALAVHAPIPYGHDETIGGWGFRDERQSWTWNVSDGELFSVNVYTRACTHVSLALNGKPVSTAQRVGIDTEFTATFDRVPYASGTLEAACVPGTVQRDADEIASTVPRAQLRTAGEPHHIELEADRSTIRADPNDLSYVTATVVDANGERVPYADNKIVFEILNEVSGTGQTIATLAAVANGNPYDRSSFHTTQRNAWRGRALAIVQPTSDGLCGDITLRASLLSSSTSTKISVSCVGVDQ